MKRLFALSGNRCAFPDCPTRLSAEGGTEFVAEICHIEADNSTGARYNPAQSDEERHGFSNLILMCGTHHTKIDGDEKTYTIAKLREWKHTAELAALEGYISGATADIPAAIVAAIIAELAKRTSIETAPDVDELSTIALAEAAADIATFRRGARWPVHPVGLALRVAGQDSARPSFAIDSLADIISRFSEVTVVANPGTGKTTTLIQLTEAAIREKQSVAVYIPLNELTHGLGPLFKTVAERPSFQKTTATHLETLARAGKLILVLDGWNELSETARHAVKVQLTQLRRNFPDLNIVASTRQQAVFPPLDGPIVEIQPLSQDQQLEIARALKGTEGAQIVDHALRTPGLRELVEIPLYLTALVSFSTDGKLPTTKEEVLRLFIAQHENDQETAEALRAIFHDEVMRQLSNGATEQGTTSLTEEDARAIVVRTHKQLVAQQQLHQPADPQKVLGLLVTHHILIRLGTEPQQYEFQHQQFQEFYASSFVEKTMLASASGDTAATTSLRQSILDQRHWEEAILFACERLSRSAQASAVAKVISLALAVDPMLSAEMIYRSNDTVWREASGFVQAFVQSWHRPGHVDRAVKFMLNTGKPEFADLIWPLLLSSDDQVSLRALSTVRRIRPGVLGANVDRRFAEVDENVRLRVISEFVFRGDIQTIELAASLAKLDASDSVRGSVAEGLAFRRADALLTDLLQTSGPAVWRKLAKDGYDREIADPAIRERLKAEREEMDAESTDDIAHLYSLIQKDAQPTEIQTALEALDFASKDDRSPHLLYEIRQKYPAAIPDACRTWLKAGKQLPLHIDEHLNGASPRSDTAVLAIAIADGTDRSSLVAAALCDTGEVATLLDIASKKREALVGQSYSTHRVLYDEIRVFEQRIANTQAEAFVGALLALPQTSDPSEINFFADLIGSHGKYGSQSGSLVLPEPQHERLAALLSSWATALVNDPRSTRAQLAELAIAICRTPSPSLSKSIKLMLDEDIRRKTSGEDRGTIWSNWYAKALVTIADDAVIEMLVGYLDNEEFGAEAARSLKAIFDRREGRQTTDRPIRGWPDYSGVAEARSRRGTEIVESACASPIMAAIERICQNGQTDAERRRALEMSVVVLSVPYADREQTIEKVVNLPLPVAAKQNLFCAMAIDGQILPVGLVRAGIDAWIESTKTQSWKLHDNNHWEIERWLALLAFTDNPLSVVAALQEIGALYQYPHQLEGVVAAFGNAPGQQGEEALIRLARECPWIASEHTFVGAFLRLNNGSALFSMLDLVKDGTFGKARGGIDRRDIVLKVASQLQGSPTVLAEAKARYLGDQSDKLLELALAEVGGPDVVVSIVRAYAQRRQPFDAMLAHAIREAATQRQPSSTWSGAYALHPQPLIELRKELYGLLGGPSEELGRKGLVAIDRLRDEYGVSDCEPRHPDIQAGGSWPRVSG
ncbi:hypothetical protein V1294_006333 [Bradyrhizobium sp. AZCC 1678]|uniref:NACHT domain-containing protein n=1 Tax=Bradyrhizobium sp. AZCC 1678 TaxID=3117030 RepID=UPI002FF42174